MLDRNWELWKWNNHVKGKEDQVKPQWLHEIVPMKGINYYAVSLGCGTEKAKVQSASLFMEQGVNQQLQGR